jgi:hypothetical protein
MSRPGLNAALGVASQLGCQLFEPDEFERRRRNRVNTLKHILHVLRLNPILYSLDFRRCHLAEQRELGRDRQFRVTVANGQFLVEGRPRRIRLTSALPPKADIG